MHSGPHPSSDRTSPLLGRRHFMIGGALALASGVGWARQPRVHNPVIPAEQFEEWVPKRFDGWSMQGSSGVVLPPPDSLRDRLYDNLVTRRYQSPDQATVMLLLTYNNRQDGVLQVHRPEVCYPVGGLRSAIPRNSPCRCVSGRSQPISLPRQGPTGPNRWLILPAWGERFRARGLSSASRSPKRTSRDAFPTVS